MVQTIKAINAQAIEDPSLTRNIGGQSVQAGEVIVTSVIAARDLELPSGDEEDETLAKQPPTEATLSARKKRKETAPPPASAAQLERTGVESDELEEPAAVPTETSGTDDELREAFEAVEQEKEKEREKEGDVPSKKEKEKDLEKEEIPAENAEAEHSTAILASKEQDEQSASEPVKQIELPVAVPGSGVGVAAAVEVPKITGILAVVTSPLKPPIVAMPIHSLPGSSTTASFANPELVEFEAMDLDAQLDKLVKLSSTPGKKKSKAVNEAMDRVKIW
ncbi:unnamed protein product [Prunus armeniaca]